MTVHVAWSGIRAGACQQYRHPTALPQKNSLEHEGRCILVFPHQLPRVISRLGHSVRTVSGTVVIRRESCADGGYYKDRPATMPERSTAPPECMWLFSPRRPAHFRANDGWRDGRGQAGETQGSSGRRRRGSGVLASIRALTRVLPRAGIYHFCSFEPIEFTSATFIIVRSF